MPFNKTVVCFRIFAANKPKTLNKKTDLNINPNSEAYRVSKDPNTDLNIQKV